MMNIRFSLLINRVIAGAIVICFSAPVLAVTIQEAFDNAIKVDPALRSSRYTQEANKENIAIARSRLLPQISLQGSTNQLTQTTTQDIPGNSSISKSFTGPSANHQFVIRQGLLRPKDIASLNFAELQSQYAEVKYQSDLSDLWLRIANAWIELVGAGQLVVAYEKPLNPLLAASKQEIAKLNQGDGTKDATVEAEAQYQIAHATYQQALQTLNAKQRTFEILTQLDSKFAQSVRLDLKPNSIFSENDRDRLWTRVREKSFELRFAEIQELLQRERIRMAKADHLPTLDVMAAWNIAKNDATSTQGYRYQNNQIGIQYMVPIYAGGSISAAERQAALALQASIADSEAVGNRLDGDFRLLWSAWLGQSARVQAGYKLLESSNEQVRATQLSYEHGVKTLMELANAELMLSRRTVDQINAVMEYLKYSSRLSRSDFKLVEDRK
jgi:protease secretion system outer membrane protein